MKHLARLVGKKEGRWVLGSLPPREGPASDKASACPAQVQADENHDERSLAAAVPQSFHLPRGGAQPPGEAPGNPADLGLSGASLGRGCHSAACSAAVSVASEETKKAIQIGLWGQSGKGARSRHSPCALAEPDCSPIGAEGGAEPAYFTLEQTGTGAQAPALGWLIEGLQQQ